MTINPAREEKEPHNQPRSQFIGGEQTLDRSNSRASIKAYASSAQNQRAQTHSRCRRIYQLIAYLMQIILRRNDFIQEKVEPRARKNTHKT